MAKLSMLVTGGAGFIGSNFIRQALTGSDKYRVVNYDVLSYAGNLENLADVESHPDYSFVQGDICDRESVLSLCREERFDIIVNFAAETHVDRSLMDPGRFIQTDVYGTHVLLDAALDIKVKRYIQISTDEVYGSIAEGSFRETDTLAPNSPYAAGKAGGDLMVRAYVQTHKLPAIITRSSNNYGPYQYPEKVIPLFITNAIDNRPLPLYGDGKNVRDWIHVVDNCAGLMTIVEKGEAGQVYNIGGGNERMNLEITRLILEYSGKPGTLIQPVVDRKGHDRRYSVDCSKARSLGWTPAIPFEAGLEQTVEWYRSHQEWWRKLKERDPAYKAYYDHQYGSVTRPVD